jgi:hypothetical protein
MASAVENSRKQQMENLGPQHMGLLARFFVQPTLGQKYLTNIYQLRNSIATKGYLNERELQWLTSIALANKMEELLKEEEHVAVLNEEEFAKAVVEESKHASQITITPKKVK